MDTSAEYIVQPEKPLRNKWFQTVDKVPVFAGTFTMSTVFWYNRIIRKAVFFMMTKNADKKREQMMMFSMDSMVPQDHMLNIWE